MAERNIEVGAVVQISPDYPNKAFAGCMLVVTEVFPSWGIKGYVQALGENRDTFGGQAYLRLKESDYVYVGKTNW
jgi:hypothetical protein